MPQVQFDRDSLARWYAQQHLQTDPAIRSIYYLPANAPPREIRLVEINDLMPDRNDDALEPIDFGVDRGSDSEHRLFVLDVTPGQWERIAQSALPMPHGWSLEQKISFEQN